MKVKSNNFSIFYQRIVSLLLLLFTGTFAQNAENELFNQLYNEIISSVTNGKTRNMDPLIPKIEQEKLLKKKKDNQFSNENILTTSTAEQLKKDIEKLVNDVQIHRTEKIRFMEDGKTR